MSDDLLPVEALQRLSRQDGVDIRPTLLRVLTDLFVQKPHHAPEELARYEELALQLLSVVGADTRAVVARKLADDERAPDAVIRRLLDDEFEVAAPILSRSVKAPRHLLLAIALEGGGLEASAVAGRPDIDPDMVRLLAHHRDDRVLEALIANPAVTPSDRTLAALVQRALNRAPLAAALLARDDLDPAALAPLYLLAGPDRRAAIREALGARPPRALAARAGRAVDSADLAMVESAADSGSRELMAETLADALGLSPAAVATLVAEPSGEGFVMLLRAVGLDRDAIARAVLVTQPEIAQSVPRFFQLVEIAETTSRGAAQELAAALAGQPVAGAPVARHEPLFDPSGAVERAGAARPAAARGRRLLSGRVDTGRSRA